MRRTTHISHLLAGLAGGLLVALAGGVLVLTGAVGDDDDERTAPAAQAVAQPVADGDGGGGEGPTINEVYDETGPGVVYVQAQGTRAGSPFGLPPDEGGAATGSGFVLDGEGNILTNAHVVEGADSVSVRFANDDEVEAEIIGADPSSDIALIKVDPDETELAPVPLGDSSEVDVGDPTIAIGNPLGYDSTLTTGIVSAVQRQIQAPNGFSIDGAIQTDASINPGNSGGPLLDARGRVIGINSQIATSGSGGSVGIGFAVPINTAKEIVPQLEEDGEVERAFLGVTTTDVTETLAQDFNLAVESGALVQDVTPGGPAAEAGLRAGETQTADGLVAGGDIIVAVDGEEIAESADVAAAIADDKPGDSVEVEYYRGEERRTTEVELGKRPRSADAAGGGGGGGELPFELP